MGDCAAPALPDLSVVELGDACATPLGDPLEHFCKLLDTEFVDVPRIRIALYAVDHDALPIFREIVHGKP